jgi:hypothetical protein
VREVDLDGRELEAEIFQHWQSHYESTSVIGRSKFPKTRIPRKLLDKHSSITDCDWVRRACQHVESDVPKRAKKLDAEKPPGVS